MMARMVESGRSEGIDSSCADDLPAPRFSLDAETGG
jgi:hypothetical protein